MSDLNRLKELLAPIAQFVRTLDASAPDAAQKLEARFPVHSEPMHEVRTLVRKGVQEKWLCDRENGGIRYSRVQKSDGEGLSIDAVHMASVGGGAHTHPMGEFDLCFAVDGDPRFDGRAEGWTVYAPNSWHIPTVEGGSMDILYFLPSGQIRFGDQPTGAVAVGLQARR